MYSNTWKTIFKWRPSFFPKNVPQLRSFVARFWTLWSRKETFVCYVSMVALPE